MNIKFFLFVLLGSSAMQSYGKTNLQPGTKAPNFFLQDETKTWRSLEEFKGKKIIVYFYPKDNTPGCTEQACLLRDDYSIFAKHNIQILGINFDSPEKHASFKQKYHLPFPLLSDSTGQVAHAYGADHGFFGYFFPNRKTFLIDEQSIIIEILHKVDISAHVTDILKMFNIQQQHSVYAAK